MSIRTPLLILPLLLTSACATDLPALDTDDHQGTDEIADPVSQAISGTITWSVDFDVAAEQAGMADCTYTRTYAGYEDTSAPWLCSDCEVVFQADVVMNEGATDCYPKITDGQASPVEWLGFDASGTFRRGGRTNYRLSEQGTVTIDGDEVSTKNTVTDLESPGGHTFGFDVVGSLTLGDSVEDPARGWVSPDTYACGWPKADPPEYSGNYQLRTSQILPDGLMRDQCGEPVRLHDFKGAYLVIDISAVDCPPCRSMAQSEPAFIEEMKQLGLETHVITLLAPSLRAVLDDSDDATLNKWVDDFALHSPVLSDRGWGYWLGNEALPDQFAYPTWILVSPELEVLDMGAGFGGWEGHRDAIVIHAGK